jgi:hypothetical protein
MLKAIHMYFSTMNLSEDLSLDKELFTGVYEGKYRYKPE